MQIKTKMRHHLTLIRMTIIKKSTNNKFCKECGEKGTLLHCQECKLIRPLWKTVWRFFKKVKTELPYDPAIPLGIYPEKAIIQKDTCTPMFTAALFTIVRTWKTLKYPSIKEWIKKIWYIYTVEYYSAIKGMKLCHLQTQKDIETLIQSELRDKNKYVNCLYIESRKMVQIILFVKQKQSHRCREQSVWLTRQE